MLSFVIFVNCNNQLQGIKLYPLTHYVEEGVLDERRVCRDLKQDREDDKADSDRTYLISHLTLVEPNICLLCELDLQLPIVRFLKDDLESGIAAVSLAAVGEEVRILVLAYPLQPGNLRTWENVLRATFDRR